MSRQPVFTVHNIPYWSVLIHWHWWLLFFSVIYLTCYWRGKWQGFPFLSLFTWCWVSPTYLYIWESTTAHLLLYSYNQVLNVLKTVPSKSVIQRKECCYFHSLSVPWHMLFSAHLWKQGTLLSCLFEGFLWQSWQTYEGWCLSSMIIYFLPSAPPLSLPLSLEGILR